MKKRREILKGDSNVKYFVEDPGLQTMMATRDWKVNTWRGWQTRDVLKHYTDTIMESVFYKNLVGHLSWSKYSWEVLCGYSIRRFRPGHAVNNMKGH